MYEDLVAERQFHGGITDWYYNRLRLWRIRSAFRVFLQRLRRPLFRVHSTSWSEDDHSHFCLAAQLLEEGDFCAVCPHGGKLSWEPGHSDECDWCPYEAVLYYTETGGKKKIRLKGWANAMSAAEMIGVCDVCGRSAAVTVCCSACGGQSFAYCRQCLRSGAEPWGTLVSYISCAGRYPEDVNEEFRTIVRDTCARLGRTEEEFAAAVNDQLDFEKQQCERWLDHEMV